MQSLSVIDSGYVDLLTKYGVIITLLYLFLFSKIIIVPFHKKNRVKNKNDRMINMATYLSQYYIVNLTWSVFTFAHGIVPMSLAIFILYKDNLKK